MSKIVIISGASSGFGALTTRALVDAGHTVYAGMRNIAGRNAIAAAEARAYSDRLRPVEMDVLDQRSVDAAVAKVVADEGRLDVVVHNAGHMVLGAAEAFTPEQYASVYDTNVLSTQRLNRAALPYLRKRGDGLVVWVGSSSTRGGTPPFLAPYFAAKAAMDALAVSYATELTRFGIDSTIIVPGAFTRGTNHFANAGYADDKEIAAVYDEKYAGFSEEVARRLADLLPEDADPAEVARQIVRVVDLPKGQRPFRVHVDPAEDGAELVNAVGDAVRQQFFRRIGFPEFVTPVR
ncbi:SDR family NAD(P)-dependent oxidoreductase [Kibdelosporangium aridum]|uniref:NADP-dependent 3-hydroxy acid dehydrogenase YdfG n=1 Tax=Kibdelosporangium aridum TaxID=2030 RepID=A0A1W1ZYL2_KIBAR|nr:SDR family NAD(P)-dependent oxidoreductase [Kibdelosporangium aridum]SMC53473.1 NADP-dependent 3-hydroxy acid dehydrogenase YdfG [Kibdelosporangium aridum]